MRQICLIACASQKQAVAAPAHHLYQSQLFRKSVGWMRCQSFNEWFILSAKHGLVMPDQILKPYDLTLNAMSVDARRKWAKNVLNDLMTLLPEPASVTFLAGAKYREFLINPLREKDHIVHIPLQGLRIGKQLQWLDAHC
jgi:hypothetical protein